MFTVIGQYALNLLSKRNGITNNAQSIPTLNRNGEFSTTAIVDSDTNASLITVHNINLYIELNNFIQFE